MLIPRAVVDATRPAEARPPRRSKINNQKSKILIVRPSALGDVARTVPCLVSLRKAFPGARIDWLVNAGFVDVVRAHPALDGVVAFDRGRGRSVLGLVRELRRRRYDAVFDFQGLARSGLLTWGSGATRRVGDANAREFAPLAYTEKHAIDPARHAADRMLALLEAAGVPRAADFTLHVPPEHAGFAETLAPGSSGDGDCLAVAPTAQWGCKCWPGDRYAGLIERALADGRVAWAAVLSAAHERETLQNQMRAALPETLHDRVAFPATDVGQMMDVIRGARLLVGNDSAPLHLAVGLGTPTVSLFGPTDPALVGPPPEVFAPLPGGVSHTVLRAPGAAGRKLRYRAQRDDDTLIAGLTLDDVWTAVAERL
ncbi:MAG: glycosyltransferase family 9 protein [Planctomycetota bacterium]